MTRLGRYLLRQGWRRGVQGGSRPWLVAGAAALAVSALHRLSAKAEEVVYRDELQPGQTVVIRHLDAEREASAGS